MKANDFRTILIVGLGVALGLVVFYLIKKLLVALMVVGVVMALLYFMPKRRKQGDAEDR